MTGHALAARALIRAARRALERGDLDEFGRLYEEADEQVGQAIEALPGIRGVDARVSRRAS